MQKDQYSLMYDLEDSHWWFLAKRAFIKALLPSKTNLLILDLGCGTGGTTRFLSRFGAVRGIEKSPAAWPFLKQRGVTFQKRDIASVRLPAGHFDLATFLDVLYHRGVKNEISVLKKAYKALKPGGILLVTDSALPFLLSRHDKVMHARERYYLGHLAKKISQAGFTVEKKSYLFFFVFPLFLLTRILNKLIPFETVKSVPSFINQWLFNLCQIEARLLPYLSFPIGSSVIIKARKL